MRFARSRVWQAQEIQFSCLNLEAQRLLAQQGEPCHLGRFWSPAADKLSALQADLLETASQVFATHTPYHPDGGLSVAVLPSATLQLLPLALTTRVSAPDSITRLMLLGGRLVRLTGRCCVTAFCVLCRASHARFAKAMARSHVRMSR